MLTIEEAIRCLQQGGVVAVPTETVYGLAADAAQPQAVKRIFNIKGRPGNHPLIVHIGSIAQVQDWAMDIPEILWPIAEQFWPGPLTVILKKKPLINTLITGGKDTIGLRIPGHKKVLQLLVALKCGLTATSANRYGHISPTTPKHVIDDLGTDIDGVIDGGACEVGIESTILDLTIQHPKVLRPGQISQQELEDFLGIPVSTVQCPRPRTAGTAGHYAPQTPLVLVAPSVLDAKLKHYLSKNISINLWSASHPGLHHHNLFWQPSPTNCREFSRILYRQMREFDQLPADITLIEHPPDSPEWRGVIDRLSRAASYD